MGPQAKTVTVKAGSFEIKVTELSYTGVLNDDFKVSSDTSAKDMDVDFYFAGGEDGDVTGINEVETAKTINNGRIYNINGQQVNGQLGKGLYIVNGKKYVVK